MRLPMYRSWADQEVKIDGLSTDEIAQKIIEE
jgi:hypothetical protein